ncbi:MAG: PTS sugar transporter subunit IIA [Planctomycetes bacterium]|nr:PTS sugar transporter subunit IIA [Planctomycetota bacterium]
MRLTDLIEPLRILLPFEAATRWDAIEKMVAHLTAIGSLRRENQADALEAIRHREEAHSTGMEHGIALPHGPVDFLPRVEAVLALAPAGVPFDSIDGRPARIVLLLLVPRNRLQKHVRTLAGIARLLNDEELRESLLSAGSPEDAYRLLRAEENTALHRR